MSLLPPAKPPQHPAAPEIAPAVGRAPWWIPEGAARPKNPRPPFARAFKDFMQHFSFHCYGMLVAPRRSERFFWIVFHITASTVLITFLWRTRNVDGRLMSTSVLDPLYPIHRVGFPAVAICSINRISNASAARYAAELNARDPMQRGVEFFFNEIQLLAYNYLQMNDELDYDEALAFQRFLDIHDTEDFELFYNTKQRMEMLTPSCEDILVKCYLGREEFHCREEFTVTLTISGFCCTFNADGKYSAERSSEMSLFGSDNGLIVYLNGSESDNFFKIRRTSGFTISVYSANDFVDIFSGGVHQAIIHAGAESYLAIKPGIVDTVPRARHLSPEARNCLFEDEMPHAFGKQYSFNKCITRCRVRSIAVLCQCLPFYAPYQFLDVQMDTVYCTLKHKECLRRYNFKWLNVITERKDVLGLELEMEDALYCPQCLPSCSETSYRISVMSLPLTTQTTSLRTLGPDIERNNSDLAVMHVYFGEPHIQYLQQFITNDWFDVFSTIGSICGLITGFSLIGICEIVFFVGKYLVTAYYSEGAQDRKSKMEPLLILP